MSHQLLLLLPLLLLPPPPLTTALPPPFQSLTLRRILHQPLFSSTTPPSPPPPVPPLSPSPDQPFFPEVPSFPSSSSSSPPPTPTVPSNAASHGPIPTATSQSSSSSLPLPSKKLAIAFSVALVTLGMLSALAFFLYRHRRQHLPPSPSDSRKLVPPPLPRGGFSQQDYDDDPPQPPNFLYLGTVEPTSAAGGNSDVLKFSPYRKLNSGKRTDFGRYRPSPELTPLPPLVRQPPPDSVVQMMSSSEDEHEDGASRGTETAFYLPRCSGVSNDEGYHTPASRQSVTQSDRSNSNGSGSNGGSNVNGNANHLSVPHSKRTSPRSRQSGSSPEMKHVIIPSIKHEVGTQNPLRSRFAAPLPPPNLALLQSLSSSSPRMSKVSTPPPPPPPPPLPPPAPRVLRTLVLATTGMPGPKTGQIPPGNRGANEPKLYCAGVPAKDAGVRDGFTDAAEADEIAGSGLLQRQNGDERDAGRPKLKPLHWDKVRATSDRETVWDQIKSSSFQLNENMMESLFGCNPNSTTIPKDKTRRLGWATLDHESRVLDPKKSQNIAILLRALNVTRDEVTEALLDGNPEGLGNELLETLVKMAPTKEEEIKLRDYNGDISKLGTAERFLKAILDVPFAFKRVEAMLYRANFDAEVKYLRKSFQTLEAASEELRNSRLFLKLLEAVLRTGNRMNVGTTRGDARAFKLDTLLKLVDIKGADGKTNLLHFVVQEIIRSEGEDANQVKDCVLTKVQSLSEDGLRKQGLQVVAGLSSDLASVKKAAGMDSDVLSSYLSKLDMGLEKVRHVLQYQRPDIHGRFFDSIKLFLREAEEEIDRIKGEEKKALSHVKEATEYFHGDAAKEEAHPLRIFLIVRDFLTNLDHVCKDVGRMHEQTMVGAARSFRLPSTIPLPVLERYKQRAIRSSDDESLSS
ncbi:hypothetical protein MLD38_005057 [Melastoma candidum]|uniref:Uncharacterized protein n=1 Tax=Melastoma candidum TaxID=119954 RepID=A0ACB9S7D7_9MYRT|nr:hypothetical protein MLD38_005057 [Melastoma candidum]